MRVGPSALYREYGAANPEACEARASNGADDLEQRVRIRAYYLWEQEGRPEGRDLEFWDGARAADGKKDNFTARAPQEFAGETGAAPLPKRGASSGA